MEKLMASYYNEFDPFAASWLKELIKDGLIADGEVDDRSITEVASSDLKGFKQCHFFAGIGGWSMALRLADWPDDRPVWTGSPPCQPFSVAGNQKGNSDERHLWPVFFDLIKKQAPPTVFGEQVASSIRHEWFDDLQKDLEAENYASAMVVLPACSVGAPHKRERLWFVANAITVGDTKQPRLEGHARAVDGESRREGEIRPSSKTGVWDESKVSALDDSKSQGRCWGEPLENKRYKKLRGSDQVQPDAWGQSTGWPCRDGKSRTIPTEPALFPLADGVSNRVGTLRGAGNAIVPQVAAEVIKAFMVSEDEK